MGQVGGEPQPSKIIYEHDLRIRGIPEYHLDVSIYDGRNVVVGHRVSPTLSDFQNVVDWDGSSRIRLEHGLAVIN